MVPEVESRIKAALFTVGAAILSMACSHDKKPTGPALRNRDKLPIMSTTGVSKLISDSGVIRYKLIAEDWKVYDRTKPQKQTFINGIFMEKFDERFKVAMYLTADTAYWYDQNLWELRGRVEIRKENGTVFNTNELFWDMGKHIVYSSKHVHIVTPQQELQGVGFRSDEELTNYEITNSAGSFPMPDDRKQEDSVKREPDISESKTIITDAPKDVVEGNGGGAKKREPQTDSHRNKILPPKIK